MNALFMRMVIGATLVAGFALSGAAENKLVVNATDGSKSNHLLSDVKRIKFDGARMVVSTAQGDASYELGAISKLTFDLSTSANQEVAASLGDLSVAVSGGVLTVNAKPDCAIDLRLYNMQGVAVSAVKGSGSASIDLNPLAKGVYIVKANKKTIKITR